MGLRTLRQEGSVSLSARATDSLASPFPPPRPSPPDSGPGEKAGMWDLQQRRGCGDPHLGANPHPPGTATQMTFSELSPHGDKAGRGRPIPRPQDPGSSCLPLPGAPLRPPEGRKWPGARSLRIPRPLILRPLWEVECRSGALQDGAWTSGGQSWCPSHWDVSHPRHPNVHSQRLGGGF